jgi:hypothetical protein
LGWYAGESREGDTVVVTEDLGKYLQEDPSATVIGILFISAPPANRPAKEILKDVAGRLKNITETVSVEVETIKGQDLGRISGKIPR